MSAILSGIQILKETLKTAPELPGVYRMISDKGEVLYVGKALNLKKRLTSYTHFYRLPERLQRMVALIAKMELVRTRSEAEALLLEANYIKKMRPHFNILLKDDKSYPQIVLRKDHPFPQISRGRGKKEKNSLYWGPFASTRAAEQSLQLIQRVFLLRSCQDTVFSSRSRPCLLYQIKRCSAPCVGRISLEDYQELVREAKIFLAGDIKDIQKSLQKEMEEAAEVLSFERAAILRDRLKILARFQASYAVNPQYTDNADVIALSSKAGKTCIQIFFIRGGRNNGHRAFYPIHAVDEQEDAIFSAFLLQFYEDKIPESQIIINLELPNKELLAEALSLRRNARVSFIVPQRGEKKDILDHALLNAREALERKMAVNSGNIKILAEIKRIFSLKVIPKRIEVYDNSHLMGQAAYGVMIVAGEEGFIKRAYRKFGIKGPLTAGDDFAMMREVMMRRFAPEKIKAHREDYPDMLLIDGGAGQVRAVQDILKSLNIVDIAIVGIAKGVERNAGKEWFFVEGQEPFQLPLRDPVLYYLQRLRDEAHRFAITTHRHGRSKAIKSSRLDDIEGIGPVRKKALLSHFGSLQQVKQASVGELEGVFGISHELAEEIFSFFHPDL